MGLTEIRKKLKEEMKDIPRGDFRQNMFRQRYAVLRMHSLGKKATVPNNKFKVFEEAKNKNKKEFPDFKVICRAGSDFEKKKLCDISL